MTSKLSAITYSVYLTTLSKNIMHLIVKFKC